MRISQLIDCLTRRLRTHGDRAVIVGWEGTRHPIEPKDVFLSTDGTLLIDADNGYEKADCAVDRTEGEDETAVNRKLDDA